MSKFKSNFKIYTYRWKKGAYKPPSKWKEYEISAQNDYFLLKTIDDESKIYWKNVIKIQLLNIDNSTFSITVFWKNENGKIKKFGFTNQYGESFKKFKYTNKSFNKIVIAIHCFCIRYKNNITFVNGDLASYRFRKIITPIYWILVIPGTMASVGIIFKTGQFGMFFLMISFAIGFYLKLKSTPSHKPINYNPVEVSKIGIKELNR